MESLWEGLGSEERAFGGLRYGGKLGEHAFYRIYTKYFDRDEFVGKDNNDAADDWDKYQNGLRIDWTLNDTNALTIQGELFYDNTGETYTFPSPDPAQSHSVTFNETTDTTGGNFLTRWDRSISDSSDMTLQIYYDRYKRTDALFEEATNTVDVDFQNHFTLDEKHQFIWGLGYRFISDKFRNSFVLSFDPEERNTHFYSGFLQDNIALIPDRFHVIVGSKIEQNYYTGFEFQPNIRILALLPKRQTLWASISHAVRTPSRVENDGRVSNEFIAPGTAQNPGTLPLLTVLASNDDFESEELLAYEFGYRIQGTDSLSLDIATFYNEYDNLRTLESDLTKSFPEVIDGSTHLVVPGVCEKQDGR